MKSLGSSGSGPPTGTIDRASTTMFRVPGQWEIIGWKTCKRKDKRINFEFTSFLRFNQIRVLLSVCIGNS